MAITKMPIGKFVEELEKALNRKDGYIMGSRGQDPKKWPETSWWFTQYSGSQRTKALYWRKNAERVWDCNGMAEGIYEEYSGVNINTKARYNYSGWCGTKGTGMIPATYRIPGAAVFWGKQASTITHVAYLYKPVNENNPTGDWYIIEARGVMYGVVKTKLSTRKPNFWGIMDKYFDYDHSVPEYIPTKLELGDRLLKFGMTGDDVKELQEKLNKLGYPCESTGKFDYVTENAVKKFQKDRGLVVDGEYGDKSHAAMKLALNGAGNLIQQIPPINNNMVTITGKSVYIRKGPGKLYGFFKVAHKDDKFERVDADGWMCVKYKNNVCWVSKNYVKDGVCTASSLNVRKGPDTSYEIVGVVKKGYKFTGINTDGWMPILVNGSIYWVSEKYVK